MLRDVVTPQRGVRVLNFIVNGNNTAEIFYPNTGSQGTLTDNGTGNYTITFAQPFAVVPCCYATPLTGSGGGRVCAISQSTTKSAVTVFMFDSGDGTTLADGMFTLQVIGQDIETQY